MRFLHWVPVVWGCLELKDAWHWKCRAGGSGNRWRADEVESRVGIPPSCTTLEVVLFRLSVLVF